MPIYEYRCHQCRRRINVWWRTFSEAETGAARCPRCGSERLSRLVSRVRLVRSEDSRMDDLSDPSEFGDLDENDPRSLGRWMKKMSSEMGEDLGPEFGEVVDRLESGQSPEEIEQALPDLGGAGAEDDSYLD
jgi:putative FmdB family regulatory protein